MQKRNYTQHEVLEIFKEQHRLTSPLDPEAEPSIEITGEMTIHEWRRANDLMKWKDLSAYLNQEFRIEIPYDNWYKLLEPSRTRKLKDVCQLIAAHAKKDNYQPLTLFGQSCLKAGIFWTIKKNLQDKGVDVSDLRPSSELGRYLDHYYSPVLEEITLAGINSIEKIDRRRKKTGFLNAINIFDPDRHETVIGDLKTFRDLVEKILEQEQNVTYE